MTEIGVYGFLEKSFKEETRSDRGGLNLFSMRDMNRLKKNVNRMPGATSGIIFNKARLPNKA